MSYSLQVSRHVITRPLDKERLEREEPAYNMIVIPRLYISHRRSKKPKGISTPCPALSYQSYKGTRILVSFVFFVWSAISLALQCPCPMLNDIRKRKPVQTLTRTFSPQAETFEPPGQQREQDSVHPNYTTVFYLTKRDQSRLQTTGSD
jgi:hypothetical protein